MLVIALVLSFRLRIEALAVCQEEQQLLQRVVA